MASEEKVSKGKAIQLVPDTEKEYDEIKNAAEHEKRSLAAFCLYHSLEAARKINAENNAQ